MKRAIITGIKGSKDEWQWLDAWFCQYRRICRGRAGQWSEAKAEGVTLFDCLARKDHTHYIKRIVNIVALLLLMVNTACGQTNAEWSLCWKNSETNGPASVLKIVGPTIVGEYDIEYPSTQEQGLVVQEADPAYTNWNTNAAILQYIEDFETVYGTNSDIYNSTTNIWNPKQEMPSWWIEGEICTNRYKHTNVVELLLAANFWGTHVGDQFDGDPRDDPRVRRAMQEYRMGHPVCEYDKGTVPIEIHHILPVTPFPEFAACKWNMISLSEKAHLSVGHAGDFQRRYVINVRDICNRAIVVEKDRE